MKKGSGYVCDPDLSWAMHFSAATENLGQLVQCIFENVIYLWWIIAGLAWVIIFYSQEYRCLNLGSWICFWAPKDVAWFSSFEHFTALGNFSTSENEGTSVDAKIWILECLTLDIYFWKSWPTFVEKILIMKNSHKTLPGQVNAQIHVCIGKYLALWASSHC